MARLEACYFCGAAEDAPLSEVTVTPRRRRDDPDAAVTLTLCSACERKLERVLGGLFEHVESRLVDDETADTSSEPVDRIDIDDSPTPSQAQSGRRRLFTDPPEVDEDGPDPESGSPEADDAEILEDEPNVTATATAKPTEALDGVSVEEYNRVMRLLQNREFPVGRTAFVDLAANAYDLREETVQQVLDAVIDQGRLAEQAGELVRTGDGESA